MSVLCGLYYTRDVPLGTIILARCAVFGYGHVLPAHVCRMVSMKEIYKEHELHVDKPRPFLNRLKNANGMSREAQDPLMWAMTPARRNSRASSMADSSDLKLGLYVLLVA